MARRRGEANQTAIERTKNLSTERGSIRGKSSDYKVTITCDKKSEIFAHEKKISSE